MEFIYIVGYFFAVLTGISLGILGGGGSMIILPIFVYIFKLDPPLAVVYSLFVVGFSSLVGSFAHFRMGNVKYLVVLVFGLPSVVSVVLTRHFVLPNIPETLIDFSWFHLDKNTFLMSFFAFMMLFAAYFMFTDKNQNIKLKNTNRMNYAALALEGIVVGFVTAIVGAGGGFLIIPALIYFAKLPVKTAIGTSLSIIALNSLVGFSTSTTHQAIDWKFLAVFSAVTSVGIIFGAFISKKIDANKLKKAFSVFILVLGTVMIVKEFFFK